MSTEDRAWKQYSERFRRAVMPQLLSSSIFLGVYDGETDGGEQEIKFATSLGLMLLHNKPIILLVLPGTTVPWALQRVAQEVIVGDPSDPRAQDALAEAMQRVRARLGATEGSS